MANSIRVKRGTESNRSSITPAIGELLYTTDEKLLFIGDGSIAGGNLVNPPNLGKAPTVDNTFKGVTISLQAGEALSFGQPVKLISSKLYKCNRSESALEGSPAIGIVVETIALNGYGKVLIQGMLYDTAYGFTSGAAVEIGASDGTLTTTHPTANGTYYIQRMGVAISSRGMIVSPSTTVIKELIGV